MLAPPEIYRAPAGSLYMTSPLICCLHQLHRDHDSCIMQIGALRLLRLHVMDSVRLRLEAGHRDFISELRHCTMLFVGFPSLRVRPSACVPCLYSVRPH